MARVQLPESRLKARKRKRRTIVLGVWAVLLFVLVGVVSGLAHLPHYRVVVVEVVGVEGTEAQAVEKAVQEQLAGRYFLLFPRNNVMLYPRSKIVADLFANYPIFGRVEVEAHDLRGITVTINKRSPKAVWCGEAFTRTASCLQLDESGMAYESAARFGGTVYTTFYGVLAEGQLPRQYLTEDNFRSLLAFAAALEAQEELKVTDIAVDAAGDVELYFMNGFKLRFALKDGGGDVFERFTLAMEAEPFVSRTTSQFEYLDLRFGDRLYYKLKGE